MSTAVVLPERVHVGSFCLETLTTGMYESAFHCIREYVQNSYDAISDAIAADLISQQAGKITISINGSSTRNLTVRDNGTGIPTGEAIDRLISLGSSTKRPQRHAGFRGIGRLAGIAYCTVLRYQTKAAGEAVATVLEFDCAQLRGFMAPGAQPQDVSDVIKQSVSAKTVVAKVHEHYTEVEMMGLVGLGLEFTQAERLIGYLGQYSPVGYVGYFPFADEIRKHAVEYSSEIPTVEVELRVGRDVHPITKPYRKSYATGAGTQASTLTRIERIGSREHGWFGWFGVSNFPSEIPDETVAGVRFRLKNIQIGDEGIIENISAGNTAKGTDRRLQRYTVGEIFVTNTEVVPNARRDDFEDNAAWRAIQADLQHVTATIVKLIRNSSKNRSKLKTVSAAVDQRKSLLNTQTGPIVKSAARQIEAELRGQLTKIEQAVSGGADPKEASRVITEIKQVQERLAVIGTKADPPPKPVAKPVLEIVREILEQELGAESASLIMKKIQKRIASGA